MTSADPGSLTTAWTKALSQPKADISPMTPSLPIIAKSAVLPSPNVDESETPQLQGNQTWVTAASTPKRIWLRASEAVSRAGLKAARVTASRDVKRKFPPPQPALVKSLRTPGSALTSRTDLPQPTNWLIRPWS